MTLPLLAMLPASSDARTLRHAPTLLTPAETHALILSADSALFHAFPTLDSDNPRISWEELAEYRREEAENAHAYATRPQLGLSGN